MRSPKDRRPDEDPGHLAAITYACENTAHEEEKGTPRRAMAEERR